MPEAFGTCPCGAAWFELSAPDDAEEADIGPAVCIDEAGNITGYAGALTCAECGLYWSPDMKVTVHGHLRLIEHVVL